MMEGEAVHIPPEETQTACWLVLGSPRGATPQSLRTLSNQTACRSDGGRVDQQGSPLPSTQSVQIPSLERSVIGPRCIFPDIWIS